MTMCLAIILCVIMVLAAKWIGKAYDSGHSCAGDFLAIILVLIVLAGVLFIFFMPMLEG